LIHHYSGCSLVQELFPVNHYLLCALGVGHAALDNGKPFSLSQRSESHSSCGVAVVKLGQEHKLPSKLTGAGGGGCAISIIPPGELRDLPSDEFLLVLLFFAFHGHSPLVVRLCVAVLAAADSATVAKFMEGTRKLGYESFECTIGQEGVLRYTEDKGKLPEPPA
jgi:hypothetical protein